MSEFFVSPDLSRIPNPKEDPIGFARSRLQDELNEFGHRVKVKPSDFTDDVINAWHESGEEGYGNAIIRIHDAKIAAKENGTDLLTELKKILPKK